MPTNTIRIGLALLAFFAVLQFSRPAAADVTISGTVGEVAVVTYNNLQNAIIRFRMTDLNQTKTCLSQLNMNLPAGYAYTIVGLAGYRELYAALLVSKKGAPINCTITDTNQCLVTGCTLP